MHPRYCLILGLLVGSLSSATWPANQPKNVPLWAGQAPGAIGAMEGDQPSLDVYPLSSSQSSAAVLVVPGGSYQYLALDHEGAQVARWLNDRGVTAFVLHYRIAPRYHYPAPILDGERAIRFIRAHATEYGIDPHRIGIWGFSAGGHLAASVTTHFDHGQPDAVDPIERVSDRPDFSILAYGVLSMQAEIAHPGSRLNLLGPVPDPALVEDFSNEKQVTRDTPPCFLFHTANDTVVPVENSLRFYAALQRVGVSSEMHIFEQGDHGVGLAQKNVQLRKWPELVEGWMRLHGWITAPATATGSGE